MKKLNVIQIFGFFLLIPPIIGVVLFILALFGFAYRPEGFGAGWFWSGDLDYSRDNGGGGGYTSPMPIYFGLMAIAGAILLSVADKANKQTGNQ